MASRDDVKEQWRQKAAQQREMATISVANRTPVRSNTDVEFEKLHKQYFYLRKNAEASARRVGALQDHVQELLRIVSKLEGSVVAWKAASLSFGIAMLATVIALIVISR